MKTLIRKEVLSDKIEIELHDFSSAMDSKENLLAVIERVAGLSFGKETVKNPEALFNHLKTESNKSASSCFEFVNGYFESDSISNEALFKLIKFGYPDAIQVLSKTNRIRGHINLRTALELGIENKIEPDPEWCKKNIYTFKLKVPLYLRSQLIRSRQASYLEISRRRVKGGFEFYRSERDIENIYEEEGWIDDKSYAEWKGNKHQNLLELSLEEYDWKVKNGVPAEVARGILPQNLFTELWVQYNSQDCSWKNTLALRKDSHAQLEIQNVYKKMEEMLNEYLGSLK